MDKRLKLQPELVPQPCWGQSLYRVSTRREWEGIIRPPIIERANGRCEICGHAVSQGMICHERWHYDDATHVAHLVGLLGICSLCNAVIHWGRSSTLARQGQLDMTTLVAHFRDVNGITERTARRVLKRAFEEWRERSKHNWTVQLDSPAKATDSRQEPTS